MEQNLSLYQIFYTTAVTGNISRAAETLFISQPAVSRSIKKLEASLGAALFVRSSRGVRLTEDGELLFFHVKNALQSFEAGENQLKLRRELGMKHLRIGASSTLCKYVLLPCLKEFVRDHPNIQVTISCQSTNHTLRMMEKGELDIGLTGKPDFLRDLHFYPILQIHDTFAAAPEYLDNFRTMHMLPELSQEHEKEILEKGTLMMLDKENLTRQYVDQYLREQSIFPENILEATTMDLLIEFTKIGLGAGCVIREFVEEELKTGILKELPAGEMMAPREVGFVTGEDGSYRRMAEQLLEYWRA